MKILFDTETTGLPKALFVPAEEQTVRIIEIGALIVEPGGKIVQEISQLLNPLCPIPFNEAGKPFKHGITDEMVKDMPTFKQFCPEIAKAFGQCDEAWAHNSEFDTRMFKIELAIAECDYFPWPPSIMDSVHEFRHLFGFRPSLDVLYERIMGVPMPYQAHRALNDVKAMYDILMHEGVL